MRLQPSTAVRRSAGMPGRLDPCVMAVRYGNGQSANHTIAAVQSKWVANAFLTTNLVDRVSTPPTLSGVPGVGKPPLCPQQHEQPAHLELPCCAVHTRRACCPLCLWQLNPVTSCMCRGGINHVHTSHARSASPCCMRLMTAKPVQLTAGTDDYKSHPISVRESPVSL